MGCWYEHALHAMQPISSQILNPEASSARLLESAEDKVKVARKAHLLSNDPRAFKLLSEPSWRQLHNLYE